MSKERKSFSISEVVRLEQSMAISEFDIVIEICIDVCITEDDIINKTNKYLWIREFTEDYLDDLKLKNAADQKKSTVRPHLMSGNITADIKIFGSETPEQIMTKKTEIAKDIVYLMLNNKPRLIFNK